MAYAGHQFGHFTPQLGDGRAILLGEILDSSGSRVDVQLKGLGLHRSLARETVVLHLDRFSTNIL